MSATIFWHEFSTRWKSVMFWSVSLTGLIFLFLSIFQSFAEEAALIRQMMEKFPPALLEAFGMARTDLSSLLGYYSFLFVFVQLCLAIQAGNYGFGLVSIEESELTADFLLTRPVSRGQVMTSKLLAAFGSLLLTELVVWAATFLSIGLYARDLDRLQTLILLLISMLVLQAFFLSVGLMISLLVRRVRSVTPYSLGLGFGSYVLAALSGILGEVKLEYVTPFKHLDPAFIVRNNAFDAPLVLLNIGITVIALVVSY